MIHNREQKIKKEVWTSAAQAACAALMMLIVAASAPYSAHAGVVIRPQNIVATGGTITTVTQGNTVYKVHTFTSTTTPGTFRVTSGSGKVWYLVVAGGGGGSFGGNVGGNGGSGVVIISYLTTKEVTSKNAPINGLVGWWPFDTSFVTDKIYDRSGRGNSGYFVGSATSSAKVPGRLGQALRFNGTANNHVSLPGSGITTGTTFTYAAWVKPASTQPTNESALFASDSGVGPGIFYVKPEALGSRKIDYYYSGGHFSNTALTDNTWNHVVVVNNAGNVTFYLNGVADGTATGASSFTVTKMGTDSGNESFSGTLDDVRIYNRALSAQEVLQLYNSR